MPNIKADANVQRISLQAKVIRADGTEEELGTIAYNHKNPLRRLVWRLFHIAT